MPVTYVFAGLPVSDFGSALDWYQRLFGRAPDRFPLDEEAVWQLASTGLVYVVSDRERAGRSLLTLIVDDLDERVQALRAAGIDAVEIDAAPGGVRRVLITDPDGNRIQLGELPQPPD